MKLRSLQLNYFRQHQQSSFSFLDGVIGIVGPNGAGKSTIVEAISFCLYGTKALRGKIDDVASRGVADSNLGAVEFSATLSFEQDGVVYCVERSRSDALLRCGGEPAPLCTGHRDATARITALLGMSYEEFVATYYTEQKGLEFLSGKKGAAERERFIVRMMGYDRLEKLQELLRNDRRDKRNEVSGFEASLGSRGHFEARIAEETAVVAGVREKHTESERILKTAERDCERARADVVRWEGAEREFSRRREVFRERQVRYDEKVKRLQELERELLSSAAKHGVPPSGGREPLQAKIAEADAAFRQIEDQHRRDDQHYREQLASARSAVTFAEQQLRTVQQREAKIGALDAQGLCPTCQQTLGASFESVREQVRGERVEQQQLFDAARSILEKLQQPPEVLRTAAVALSEARTRLEAARGELQNFEQHYEAYLRRAGMEREREVLREAIVRVEEELRLARVDLENQKFSEDEFRREKGRADATQRLVEVARLQRLKLEGDLKTAEAMLARSKEELRGYDEKVVSLQQAKVHLDLYDQGDQVLTEFRKFLNSGIRPRLSELASEFMTELTDGRYTTVDVGEDFSPSVLDQGELRTVLSGGEEDILNLSLRLALSHMIAERSGQTCALLILDEVFGSLDEQRRGNVLGLLERLAVRFEQILIITHLDDVKENVQHLLHVKGEGEEDLLDDGLGMVGNI